MQSVGENVRFVYNYAFMFVPDLLPSPFNSAGTAANRTLKRKWISLVELKLM